MQRQLLGTDGDCLAFFLVSLLAPSQRLQLKRARHRVLFWYCWAGAGCEEKILPMDGGIGTDVLCLRSCPLVRPHHIPTRYVRYTVMLEKRRKNGGMRFGSDRVHLPLKKSITSATRSTRCSYEVVFGRHRQLERRSAFEALLAQVYLSRESEIPTTLYTPQPWSVSTVLLCQNPSFSAFPCNSFVSGFR